MIRKLDILMILFVCVVCGLVVAEMLNEIESREFVPESQHTLDNIDKPWFVDCDGDGSLDSKIESPIIPTAAQTFPPLVEEVRQLCGIDFNKSGYHVYSDRHLASDNYE